MYLFLPLTYCLAQIYIYGFPPPRRISEKNCAFLYKKQNLPLVLWIPLLSPEELCSCHNHTSKSIDAINLSLPFVHISLPFVLCLPLLT